MADLETLPDDGLRYELIDGVLVVSPSPALPHQSASTRLVWLFVEATPAEYKVFHAPLDLQPDSSRSFQPDLMVVRREDATGQKLTGTPVLAVEILSPSTGNFDRTVKFNAYAAAGLGQYWIVDPGSDGSVPSIEVYDLVAGAYDDVPGETSVGYELQVRAVGDEQVSVAGPVPVDVIPAELIA